MSRSRGRARPVVAVALAVLAALVVSACGTANGSGRDETVLVFAAASLTEAFTELAEGYEQAHPVAEIQLSFAGSSHLVQQIGQGAPADVLATADHETMRAAIDVGAVSSEPQAFAANELTIAVPEANPAMVSGLQSLGEGSLLVAACAPEVPCGRATRLLVERSGIEIDFDTEEPSVRSVLTKVGTGEVDAGFVYRTDVRAHGDVMAVPLPRTLSDPVVYELATTQVDDAAAGSFTAFVLSPEGQRVLEAARVPPRSGVKPSTRPPALVLIAGVLGFALLGVPLVALVQRVPWSQLTEVLTRESVLAAVRLSVITTTSAVVVSIVLGVPLAWMLARWPFPGRSVVRAIVLLPMVLPPVVGGATLLFAFGRRGLVGQWLDRLFGLTLPFTTTGAVIAASFVALPFLVVTVEGALAAADERYEEAAATLGANRWTRFRRVTIPLIRSSIGAGAALAAARALGEFGATITFAGNLQGKTQTLPLAVFLALESDPEAALALSLLDARRVLRGARAAASPVVADPMSGIDLYGRVRREQLVIEPTLQVARGETVAIVGLNGSGKTSILHVICGLLPLEAGRMLLDDVVVDEPAESIWVAPEDRSVASCSRMCASCRT